MKLRFFVLLLLVGNGLSAQIYLEGTFMLPYSGGDFSAIAFGDIDGDNDPDLLVTGRDNVLKRNTDLFLNKGVGVYEKVDQSIFEHVDRGSVAFADIDGDLDQDVLLTGQDRTGAPIALLYVNDGAGNFTQSADTYFEGVEASSIAFADIDNDQDQDVLITGRDKSFTRITTLYINDGKGSFYEQSSATFVGLDQSTSTFLDIDGDQDQDLFLTGQDRTGAPTSILYTNLGAGRFSIADRNTFDQVKSGAVASADVDMDGDWDLLITGQNEIQQPITKLYLNDGKGLFTEEEALSMEGVHFSSVAISDVDGDLDQDILIAGLTHSLKRITKLYVNDGAGFFSELSGNTLEGVEAGAILLMDIDSDSDKDVLITGRNNDLTQVGRIYLNTTHESPVTHLISNQGAGLTLYPNPSETGEIFIDYTAEEVGEVNLRIFNMNGQLLNQVRKPLNIGKQTLQMDISALSRGNYIIQVEDALGTRSQLFSTL